MINIRYLWLTAIFNVKANYCLVGHSILKSFNAEIGNRCTNSRALKAAPAGLDLKHPSSAWPKAPTVGMTFINANNH